MHDAQRHLSYVRQALGQDKAPLGLLLGAGCPLAVPSPTDPDAPLIPAIAGLTRDVSNTLEAGENAAEFAQLGEILAEDETGDANVETWMTTVRALKAVAGNGEVRRFTATQLDALDRQMADAIVRIVDVALPGPGTAFHGVAAWAGSVPRSVPAQLFTTNYDLLLEQAFEELRVPYFDGFVGSRRAFLDVGAMEDDVLPPRWARIWKLHGSLNWRMGIDGSVWRGREAVAGEYRLIHPSHLKYEESRRMPYLAMIDRLRAFLRAPGAALVTCGYSFGDQHLNEVLMQGLEGNPTAIAWGLLYGPIDGYGPALGLAQRRGNLNLFAADQGVIGTVLGPWAPLDAGEMRPATVGVRWTEQEERYIPAIELGDFASFSRFLTELMGRDTGEEPGFGP